MVTTSLLVSLVLNAISAILILVLAALGLAIIFGFMEVINLAHGAFITLGAYTVWVITTVLGLNFWIGFVLAPFVVALIGLLAEVLVVRHLYSRLFDTLLATWGLALAIREVIKLTVGVNTKQVNNPLGVRVNLLVTTYPAYRLFLIVASLLTLAGVFLLFTRTNFGVRLRAVIQDEEAAELLGTDHERMYHFAYSFGAGLAGFAGAALTPITSVEPNMGAQYLIQSFFAVIVGGTGTLLGVVPGSVLVAGSTNVMTFFLSPVVAQTIVFVFVIIVLALRPRLREIYDDWRDNA